MEASGGILLLAATAVALIWANSPWASSYSSLWQMKLTVGAGDFVLSKPILLWINDGLMAVFFFVVGLEIKREVLVGELASARSAALPMAAALGGIVAPAGIYLVINAGRESATGWGIPMATDIAFALGILALLGDRVPIVLKVFLTALAIVDDLAAVLVIAVFYTAEISGTALAVGGGAFLLLIAVNALGVRRPLVYVICGLVMWFAFLKSGVHPTVAGVLLALTIPARPRIDPPKFLRRARRLLEEFEQKDSNSGEILISEARQAAVQTLEQACEEVETPLQRLEHELLPWIKIVIMPLFALANAGVALRSESLAGLLHPASLGVAGGLVLGKPIGIFLFAWLAVRFRLAVLPDGMTWTRLLGLGLLGGIGFTMSIFIAGLAFGTAHLLDLTKTAVLAASLLAGAIGFFLLRRSLPASN